MNFLSKKEYEGNPNVLLWDESRRAGERARSVSLSDLYPGDFTNDVSRLSSTGEPTYKEKIAALKESLPVVPKQKEAEKRQPPTDSVPYTLPDPIFLERTSEGKISSSNFESPEVSKFAEDAYNLKPSPIDKLYNAMGRPPTLAKRLEDLDLQQQKEAEKRREIVQTARKAQREDEQVYQQKMKTRQQKVVENSIKLQQQRQVVESELEMEAKEIYGDLTSFGGLTEKQSDKVKAIAKDLGTTESKLRAKFKKEKEAARYGFDLTKENGDQKSSKEIREERRAAQRAAYKGGYKMSDVQRYVREEGVSYEEAADRAIIDAEKERLTKSMVGSRDKEMVERGDVGAMIEELNRLKKDGKFLSKKAEKFRRALGFTQAIRDTEEAGGEEALMGTDEVAQLIREEGGITTATYDSYQKDRTNRRGRRQEDAKEKRAERQAVRQEAQAELAEKKEKRMREYSEKKEKRMREYYKDSFELQKYKQAWKEHVFGKNQEKLKEAAANAEKENSVDSENIRQGILYGYTQENPKGLTPGQAINLLSLASRLHSFTDSSRSSAAIKKDRNNAEEILETIRITLGRPKEAWATTSYAEKKAIVERIVPSYVVDCYEKEY